MQTADKLEKVFGINTTGTAADLPALTQRRAADIQQAIDGYPAVTNERQVIDGLLPHVPRIKNLIRELT